MKRSFLIKPMHGADYPLVVYGQGVYLYDDQGKQYLDGSSGAVTASIGHAVEEVVEAMYKQAQKVSFVYRSQMTSEPAEELAEKLNELAFAGEGNYSSFFVNSGSEATETAMKIAIQHWQEKGEYRKNKVISRWTSYHGITIGALSLSGHPERRKRFLPLLDENPAVSAPNCYRCPFNLTYPGCQLACASELHVAIKRYGAESIAAFIAEPIVGASGGVIVPPEGYYQKIREICDYHNILFIADEVMTGIGRTGKMFAMEHWGIKPDIITLGKGMSAGYTPMAATMVSDNVMEPIIQGSGSIMSGHTYSANPQSAAVSLAVLRYIEKHELVKKSAESGAYLIERLWNLQRKFSIIGEIRGKGLMVGVELVSDVFTKNPFSKELSLTTRIVERAREKGLLLYPSAAGIEGGDGDAIIISPPLTIKKNQIDKLIDIFSETMSEIQSEMNLNIFKAL